MLALPIDGVLPELLAALAERPCAVVVAPPGSGKTTRVPPALLELGPPVAGPEVPFDPARLDDHVGTYEDVVNGAFTIEREGDGLTIDWPLLAAYDYEVAPELVPISDAYWLLEIDGVPYDLTFVGEPGTPSDYAANRVFVGRRVEEGKVSVSLPPPPVLPEPVMHISPLRRF